MNTQDETKNVPVFIQKRQRQAQEDAYYDNFTEAEHAMAEELKDLAYAAYICKDTYKNTRKTKLVVKVDGPTDITAQHQAMKDFVELHGFERKVLNNSYLFSYKPQKVA